MLTQSCAQAEMEHEAMVRRAFHGACHRLNAEHLARMHAPQDDTLDRRQEKLALIRELRDTTQSRSTYDRCVAIVGEGR